MGSPSRFFLCFLPLAVVFCSAIEPPRPAAALPLTTDSRWIVDEAGRRVKLACLNWVSHLEPVVAEGLSKQPVDEISKKIAAMGFNCVRLTWPLYLATNESLANLTVRQSLQGLGLLESIAGFQAHNPSIVDLPLIKAFQAVVSSLGENKVMVILDNHISKPGWCCSSNDGNGFFGDIYFDPDVWLKGLAKMATLFKGTPFVVGMSLRNELRGPRQNVDDWYRYMQRGAEVVHAANPDVLVIISGLSFDKDFSFLSSRPLNLSFTKKLVFELHWYGFTDGSAWRTSNPNQVCGLALDNIRRSSGFLLDQGHPLFVSEFGVDQSGSNVNDNRYLSCFMAMAAELDLDWALWTLVGSYYLRGGVRGYDETYGIFSLNWGQPRNSSFLNRISVMQSPFQGPGLAQAKPHIVIFHPLTGLCIQRRTLFEPLKLGPCSGSEAWSYTPEKTLTIKGTYFCLQAVGLGKPAKLGVICTGASSRWQPISDSKMHLSTTLEDGTAVCLDIDPGSNVVFTNACKCLERDNMCDPASQWFKFVNTTLGTRSATRSIRFGSVLEFLGRKMLGGIL
ncbi:glycosyl hydrolase 5 family protein-like [Diospyros lotus]|uniref:glycosyl hydrolase 5 family protein-like n=1 Tax=Diospyros lotus TaxID=55363 RepID=UPI0022502FDB|nr:glycosyl hydrolase 5 family protein-like [Diospyros lotus]